MAANSKVLPLFSPSSFLIFIQLLMVSVMEANNNGFTIDLIHRDSPLSPYYNSSISQMERLNKACHRSYERAASFKLTSNSSDTIQSSISPAGGSYLMKVSIGTPPVEMLSVADIGSDLAWVQCKPCPQCYKQTAPLFDPGSSSTYKNMVCQSQYCQDVGRSSCARDNTCLYTVLYGDMSYSAGDLAVETFTFGSTSGQSVSIPQVAFGCGHQNNGNFRESMSSIVGLGGSTLSIVNQLNKYIDGKFSYYLVPFGASDATSKLNFGSNAIVSGPQVVSTPLVQKSPDTFYYLTLGGISVGDKKLAYQSTLSNSKASTVRAGNIIIDSGTTLTMITREFYENLESTLEQSISGQRTSASNGVFSLCYQTDGNINFPKITFHFTDADLELKPSNTFVEVEASVVCLAIVPVDGDAIFGNLSQMDFLVGYDLVNKKVSFLPTDCTKQS